MFSTRRSTFYLLRQTGLDQSEESINVGWFKGNTRPNVFHGLFTNSCGHKTVITHSEANKKQKPRPLKWLRCISPCCLAFDGTGMLLNSFTSRTLSHKHRSEGEVLSRTDFGNLHLAERLLTSCPSWVWRCRVSAFHYAEEWTSTCGTWEGTQSGPVGSEWPESGRK